MSTLNCPNCQQKFDDTADRLPYTLPQCHHTLCIRCIQDAAKSDKITTCPLGSCKKNQRNASLHNLHLNKDVLLQATGGSSNSSSYSVEHAGSHVAIPVNTVERTVKETYSVVRRIEQAQSSAVAEERAPDQGQWSHSLPERMPSDEERLRQPYSVEEQVEEEVRHAEEDQGMERVQEDEEEAEEQPDDRAEEPEPEPQREREQQEDQQPHESNEAQEPPGKKRQAAATKQLKMTTPTTSPMANRGRKAPASKKAAAEPLASSSSSSAIAEKSSQGAKRRRKTKSREATFSSYIYRVLKTIHPNVGMSTSAMGVMNSFIKDSLQKIAEESNRLMRVNRSKTLTSREIQTAVRLVLPGELAKHAVSEGTKAVSKFSAV